jgi:hypothetical protein
MGVSIIVAGTFGLPQETPSFTQRNKGRATA